MLKKLLVVLFFLLLPGTWALAQIEAPDSAEVGTPVTIKYDVTGIEGTDYVIIKKNLSGNTASDTWIDALEAGSSNRPITIFWSRDAGDRLIILVTHSTEGTMTVTEHILKYGEGPPPPPPAPSPEYQAKVAVLKAYVAAVGITKSDLENLNKFYSQFSATLAKSGSKLATTADFRAVYIEAGKQTLGTTGINDKYDGLSNIVDKVYSDTLGLDIVPLQLDVTVKLTEAIAWAFRPSDQ